MFMSERKTSKQVYEKYKFRHDIYIPGVVLGVRIHDPYRYDQEYTAAPGRAFQYISHQTAGHACHHHYLFATELKVRPEIMVELRKIDDAYFYSDMGMWGTTLDEINEYRAKIKAISPAFDCNIEYRQIEEGFYPIDCTTEAIKAITAEQLPEKLDDLLVWEKEHDKFFGMIGRWELALLGQNCD